MSAKSIEAINLGILPVGTQTGSAIEGDAAHLTLLVGVLAVCLSLGLVGYVSPQVSDEQAEVFGAMQSSAADHSLVR